VLQAGVAVALLTLVVAMLAGAAPTLVGYESFVVLSGSMAPALRVGDLAVVAPVGPELLRVGDIITYRTPLRPNVVVTHRLVGIGRNDAGRLTFETRGDANDSVDEVEIDGQAVLGHLAYAVPKVGYLVDFAKQPIGKAVLLGLPGLLLVVDGALGWRTRRAEPGARTSSVEVLVRRAWVAQRNGRVTEALALLDEAIPRDPTFEEAWLLKAECLGDPGQRLNCLWEGLAANPDSTSLRAASEDAASLVMAAQPSPGGAPPSLTLQAYQHVLP